VGVNLSVLEAVAKTTFFEALRAFLRDCSARMSASEEEMSSLVRYFFS
jgi:hypothetical protein